MQSIDVARLYELDAQTIAERIDTFFYENHNSRYPNFSYESQVSAISIYNSKSFQTLCDHDKKQAILLYFRSRFESELCSQYFGIENHIVHSDQNKKKWQTPKTQIQAASTRQASIIASRIAFECLMEFVYFTENKKLIPTSGSKIGQFRKWLLLPNNKFRWLIFYLIVIYQFDRTHRTPEIHGLSYIALDALSCNEVLGKDTELDATNLMLNIWHSILNILNGNLTPSASYSPEYEQLFKHFFNWQEIDLKALWEEWERIPKKKGTE